MHAQRVEYRDPTLLNRILKWLLWLLLVSISLLFASHLFELVFEYSGYQPEQLREMGVPYFPRTAELTGSYLLVMVSCSVAMLSWIYRCNYNLHQLGAKGLRFSPFQSIAWYFVPVAFFWKPYQAMVELCRHIHTLEGKTKPVPVFLLRLWWVSFVTHFLAHLLNPLHSLPIALHSPEALCLLATDILSIILLGTTLQLVSHINQSLDQIAHRHVGAFASLA